MCQPFNDDVDDDTKADDVSKDDFSSNLDTPSCDQIRSMKIAISHIFGPNGNIDLVPTLVRFGNSTSLPVPEIALVIQQRLR